MSKKAEIKSLKMDVKILKRLCANMARELGMSRETWDGLVEESVDDVANGMLKAALEDALPEGYRVEALMKAPTELSDEELSELPDELQAIIRAIAAAESSAEEAKNVH